jgi:putative restriction endonuclease
VLDQSRIRLEAIQHVRRLRERWAAVPAAELAAFVSGGRRIHLRGQQGIFKPRELDEPLSITSTLDSPYTHDAIEGSKVLYDFLPATREHENDGLKRCAESQLPLIYFLQVKRRPSPEYLVFAPVFVARWDDDARRFLIDLSEQTPAAPPASRRARQLALPAVHTPDSPMEVRELSKAYVVTSVQQRLRHARFRNDVLAAYRERCAVCVLHVRALLDAAAVVADLTGAVNEGIALCGTHHRAFDAGILRYDSEYRVRIELPERQAVGEGERRMLLDFDGMPLALAGGRGALAAHLRCRVSHSTSPVVVYAGSHASCPTPGNSV